ncbi:GNAT family N-acetyltransferase [Klenkia brasiliensis]|uniref:Protein N-acetyltransferase, RimJ/RimL family n=1 Tax=Klenkia brasiliensis TaxID=333142 RepID=A0A1G7ZGJ7_9ACTN|nr:GNAT family N-acetyltransferase [Klenkia brasiliensis]SDH07230.1 Protein N-acetyltransferase, RimJ/RimL family [Klenkia brasiliensis]
MTGRPPAPVGVRAGTPLVTPRLVVRSFRVADTADLLSYQDHPDVRRHLPGPAMDAAAAGRYVAAQAALTGAEVDAWHGWAVELRATGRVIGDVGVWVPAGDPPRGDVGFQLAPSHHRQGFATEAVSALCDHLLGTAGLVCLTAGCDAANAGSQAVLRAVGMTALVSTGGTVRFELRGRAHPVGDPGSQGTCPTRSA